MAAKTFYLADVAVSGFGTLTETDPGAATTNTGWVVGKTAAGNFSKLLYGTERLANTFSTTNGLTTPATPASGDSWRSTNTINGSFANANWTLTFAVRAITSAGTQRGRINVRIWKSANATGASGTQLTSAILTGGILAGISTSADNTTAVTWSPGGTVTLTNEYLFVQCQWEITTAGGANGCDIDFRTTATVVTSDFTAAVDGNASGATVSATTSLIAGAASGGADVNGTTQSASANLLAGTAGVDSETSGQLLTTAASMLAGAANADGAATAATLAATVSTVDGVAAAAAAAAGSINTSTASLLDGAGAADAAADGQEISAAASLIDGTATGAVGTVDAEASGGLMAAGATLTPGNASGTVTQAGINSLLAFWLGGGAGPRQAGVNSLLAFWLGGGAGPAAVASGQIVTVSTDLIAGVASGEIHPIHEEVGGGAGPLPRQVNAIARGRLLRAKTRILPGHAIGTVTTLSILEAGAASGSALIAANETIAARSLLIVGKANGERYISEDEMMVIFAEAA